MSSILDLASVRARLPRISVEEYHRQPEFTANGKRTELIRGLVIEKMSKSPLHQSIARRLFRVIWDAAGSGYLVDKESPLTLHDSEPEPDILVVQGPEDAFTDSHPQSAQLVVEIAVTTADEDRALASIYAEAGVSEYWIVLAKEKSIEVYRDPEAGQYREMRRYLEGDELLCGSIPALCVNLRKLFGGA